MQEAATKIGLDPKKVKISNRSTATAVSHLARKGVSENELIKITGHNNIQSLKPYLQIDKDHHRELVNKLRGDTSESIIEAEQMNCPVNSTITHQRPIIYQNCNFTCKYLNCSNFNNMDDK
jgi:hypothetical protein